MIVKIQRPLFSTHDTEECLIYNQDRSYIRTVPAMPGAFADDEYKVYWNVMVKGDAIILLGRAAAQAW